MAQQPRSLEAEEAARRDAVHRRVFGEPPPAETVEERMRRFERQGHLENLWNPPPAPPAPRRRKSAGRSAPRTRRGR